MADQFVPTQAIERFGQGAIVDVAARANGRESTGLGQALGKAAGEMLLGGSMWWIIPAIPP